MSRKPLKDYRNHPLVPALRARLRMEDMRRYLEGGRRFAGLPRDELERFYADCYRLVLAEDYDDPRLDDALAELGAELELRRLPEPLHLIEPWLPAIRDREFRDARDPAFQAALARRLERFARDLDRPKH